MNTSNRLVDTRNFTGHTQKMIRSFKQALAFTNAIGEVAEYENHHPEITLTWGLVTVRIWTHKIDGLTESDFILAAKISTLEKPTS